MALTYKDYRSLALLLGSPRSGTTWLAKIIDSHPQVLYRHEPDSINVRPELPFVPVAEELETYIDEARDYLELISRERASKSSGSQPIFNKRYRNDSVAYTRKAMIYAIKVAERLPGVNRTVAKWQQPDLLPKHERANILLFMKSVSSLCRAQLFSLAEPDLRIIHIVRHPCAYVASTLRGKGLGVLSDDAYIDTLAAMPEAQKYGLTMKRLSAMSRAEQLAARWMLQNEKVMLEMAASEHYKLVIYEALCADPISVTAQLFQYLGLDVSDQTTEFVGQSTEGDLENASYFELRRDSLAASTRWQQELEKKQISSIEQLVAASTVGRLYFDR